MKLEKNNYSLLIGTKDNLGRLITKIRKARCMWSRESLESRMCPMCDGTVFISTDDGSIYPCIDLKIGEQK